MGQEHYADDEEFVMQKTWVLGGGGESCDHVCASEHMGCDADALDNLHNQADICVNMSNFSLTLEMSECEDPSVNDTVKISRNAARQLKAFETFGIDCNSTYTTTIHHADTGTDTFPAFAKLKGGINQCHLTPKEGQCHNGDDNHMADCLCGSQPPEVLQEGLMSHEDTTHPYAMHRLCACSEQIGYVESTKTRLEVKGLIMDNYGVSCALAPAAAPSGAEAESPTEASGSGGAVAALSVIVGILFLALLVMVYLLMTIQKKVPQVQMKQMNPAA